MRSLYLRTLYTIPFVCLTTMAQAAEPMDSISTSIEDIQAERYEQAFSRLKALDNRYSGEVEYDYWLGVAAMRAGDSAYALFPLERVVERNPNHAGARMELIAAYLQQKMDDSARYEINQAERLNPPAEAKQALAKYRSILQERDSQRTEGKRLLMIGMDVGYDSNVSSYPETTLRLPVFNLPIALQPTGSAFSNVRGAYWRRFDRDNGDWFAASVAGFARKNQEQDAKQFDLGVVQLRGEYTFELGNARSLRLAAEGSELWLNGEHYRRHVGASARWQEPINSAWMTYAEAGFRSYLFDAANNDYRAPSLTLGARYRPNTQTQVELTAEGEWEQADAQRINGNTQRLRLGASLEYQIADQHRIGFDWHLSSQQHSRDYLAGTFYNSSNSDIQRRDTISEFGANWTWYMTPKWHLGLRVQHRDQRSNVDFYQYQQTLGQVSTSLFF